MEILLFVGEFFCLAKTRNPHLRRSTANVASFKAARRFARCEARPPPMPDDRKEPKPLPSSADSSSVWRQTPVERLFAYEIPLLAGRGSGLRAGFVASCAGAILLGAPVPGVTGLFFLVLASLAEAPGFLAGTASLLVSGILERSVDVLFPSIVVNHTSEILGYAVFCLGTIFTTTIGDVLETDMGNAGGLEAAVADAELRKSIEGHRREERKRQELRRSLGLQNPDNADSNANRLAADKVGMDEWDLRLKEKNSE